ncbi:MAG: sigma-70 family RNA polymerase sigma factor [Saprospiraceae bacterium]|nr:sigma-70 family RNA polymerase sigma factor [Saprospiraceae bacterium]
MTNRLNHKKEDYSLSQNDETGMSSEDIIKSFYRDHREEFIHFGIKYNMDKENLIDIFQDVVIIFFEQKEMGKLDQLRCTDKTYLFSLGKHKIIEFLRKNNRKYTIPHDQLPDESINPQLMKEETMTDRQKLLASGLKQLGKKCRDMITLFYTRQLTISEIATMMGYKNDNVVKAHKSRCMKNLKENVSKMMKT